MKSKIKSRKIPAPRSSVRKNIAHNIRVSPVSEMRHRTKRYESSYSPYVVEIKDGSKALDVSFTNSRFSESISIPKTMNNIKTYNSAFGKYNYDVTLISVRLNSDNHKLSEYVEAVYWGTVKDPKAESFVKKNARIVESKYALKPQHNTNITTRFTCTDVNAYTRKRKPNPWCRGTMLLLYENNKMLSNVRNHPKLAIPSNDFSRTYSSQIMKNGYIY